MSEVVLSYFNLRGRADPIRFALAIANIDYTERVINFAEWSQLKASGEFEFLALPALDIDGHRLVEMVPIVIYIMTRANLHPTDLKDAYNVESLASAFGDFADKIADLYYQGKMLEIQEYLQEQGIQSLKAFEKRYQKYGTADFIYGNQVTILDVFFFHILHNYFKVPYIPNGEEILNEVPTLKQWVESFPEKFPSLQHHLQTREDRIR